MRGWRCTPGCGRFAVEGFELVEIDALDVAADAAFGEAERHPGLEVRDDSRLHVGVFVEVEVQAVGEGVHQSLQPGGACCVLLLQLDGIDEELHAQVLIDFGFAFGFGEAAHRVDVVGLDAIEVVLGLGVDHAEDGVGVGLAVDVRDAPVVADDGDVARLSLPARDLRVSVRMKQRERRRRTGEEERDSSGDGSSSCAGFSIRDIRTFLLVSRSRWVGGVNSLPASVGVPPPPSNWP